jgi:hypothetical protein
MIFSIKVVPVNEGSKGKKKEMEIIAIQPGRKYIAQENKFPC